MEVRVYMKEDKPSEDEILSFFSRRAIVHGEEADYRSYVSENIHIVVKNDGALLVSDCNDDGLVFFYPDQLDHLKRALDAALAQRALRAGKSF